MPKLARDKDGLTLQEGKYALLRARGMSQRQAYNGAFPKSRASEKSIDQMAYMLETRLEVRLRINELLQAAKATDLDSQGKAYSDLLTFIDMASSSKQLAALGTFQRLRMDHLGMLKSGVLDQSQLGFSEENLIERLAGQNPELKRQLAALLGKPTFQKQDSSDTKH
jgi:hypothetical protein